jgi:membrane fusion protein, multidrug efflux system
MSEYHETGAPVVTKPMIEEPERQRSGQVQRPRFMRKTLIAIIALIGIGAGVYFLAIAPRIENNQALNVAAAAAGKRAVTVVAPTQTSSAPDLVLPGNIQANQQTSIYARVDGYIARWYTDIGARVSQGQVLAEIDAPQIDANLRMAQAQLELAEANLKLAQTNSVRSQQLFQNHVIAQQELDTVVATEQVQKATRDNAAAVLNKFARPSPEQSPRGSLMLDLWLHQAVSRPFIRFLTWFNLIRFACWCMSHRRISAA